MLLSCMTGSGRVFVMFFFFLRLGILQRKICLFYPVKVTCRVLKMHSICYTKPDTI